MCSHTHSFTYTLISIHTHTYTTLITFKRKIENDQKLKETQRAKEIQNCPQKKVMPVCFAGFRVLIR